MKKEISNEELTLVVIVDCLPRKVGLTDVKRICRILDKSEEFVVNTLARHRRL